MKTARLLVVLLVIPASVHSGTDEPPVDVFFTNFQRLHGAPGSKVEFSVELAFTAPELEAGRGIRAWTLGLAVSGARVKEVSLAGLEVPAVFDDDGDPATPPVDPFVLDLGTAAQHVGEAASGDYPGSPVPGQSGGVVSVVLDDQGRMEILHPAHVPAGRLVVEATVPNEGCVAVGLAFVDGL